MEKTAALIQDHSKGAIKERLEGPQKHSYVADVVLGAIDGCITTFAIVASAVGAGLPKTVALVLGVANLLADGFSMAASNYQSAKTSKEIVHATRKEEEHHIETIPEGEREEIRQIFAKKGFEGKVLEEIVDTITSDKDMWVDMMLKFEHGLQTDLPCPIKSGIATFLAFIGIGMLPLVPFMIPMLPNEMIFPLSCAIAAVTFFFIGVAKGVVITKTYFTSGLSTLAVGGIAALIAYAVGEFSKQWLATML